MLTPRPRRTLCIEELLRAGELTYDQIAERFHISRQRVGQIAQRAGLTHSRGRNAFGRYLSRALTTPS